MSPQVKGKSEKMMIFGFLADEKGLKLDQIPPVPRYITHKIKDYIPYVYFKMNRVGFWLICPHRWRVNLKKMTIFGFLAIEKGLKLDQTPLYLGKKDFLGGFYPFPSKSENDTKFEKNWWDGLSPPGQLGFHLSQLFS